MKKLVLTAIVTVFMASNAFAFGIPSTGSRGGDIAVGVAKKGVNKGLEASINDKIAKKNCAFKDSKTKTDTTCDLDAIIKDLKGWRTGLEGTVANNVSVNVEASADQSSLAWDRVSYVQDRLRSGLSSWRWNTHKTTNNGNKLKITVSVD